MLFLSIKQHRMGIRKVWVYPMPLYPWFDRDGQKSMMKSSRKYSLPQPVSARPSQRRSNSRRHAHNEKSATKSSSNKPQNRMSAFWVWVDKPKSPPDVYTRDRRREQPRRTTSGRRWFFWSIYYGSFLPFISHVGIMMFDLRLARLATKCWQ